MKRAFLFILLSVALSNARAYEPLQRKVYMFGFAASFTDSVAYITDVQAVDMAYVHYNGFLADRPLYSAQLNVFLQSHLKQKDMTCVIYYDKSKSKVEKKYLKVRKKYREKHNIIPTPLGRDQFTFKREEWVDPAVTEMPDEQKAERGGSKKK